MIQAEAKEYTKEYFKISSDRTDLLHYKSLIPDLHFNTLYIKKDS